MTGGTFSTTIDAPIGRVWAVVGDFGTHASWSPKPYEFSWTGGEPNQVGATYHSKGSVPGNSHNENDGEITERTEPTHLAFKANDPQGVFLNAWDLRSRRRQPDRGLVHDPVPQDARDGRGPGADRVPAGGKVGHPQASRDAEGQGRVGELRGSAYVVATPPFTPRTTAWSARVVVRPGLVKKAIWIGVGVVVAFVVWSWVV